MTLDVRGSLKNTKLSKNPYVVFEELLSNAIDSFLIRKHSDVTASNLEVTFDVEFLPPDLLGDEIDLKVTCSDNGCGLGDAQANAFLTKDALCFVHIIHREKAGWVNYGVGHCLSPYVDRIRLS